MNRNIRIGRWQIELYRRALHLTRLPDPHCTDCDGTGGGWITAGDWNECHCLDAIRTWRLPLWRRPTTREEYPF